MPAAAGHGTSPEGDAEAGRKAFGDLGIGCSPGAPGAGVCMAAGVRPCGEGAATKQPVQGVCLEAEGSVRKIVWNHVGEGKGAYELVDKFSKVGQGLGDHKVDESEDAGCGCCPSWLRRLLLCIVFLGVIVLGCAIALRGHVVQRFWDRFTPSRVHAAAPPSTRASAVRVEAAAPRFSCELTDDNWQTDWTLERKDHCCRYQATACPPNNNYDCQTGLDEWSTRWSPGQQNYCCGYDHKACESILAVRAKAAHSKESFNCEEDLFDWTNKWSGRKKKYCCRVFDFGCADDSGDDKANTDGVKVDSIQVVADAPKRRAPPPTAPTAPAAPTAPSAPADAAAGPGCDVLCNVNQQSASCKDRIHWLIGQPASAGGFLGVEHACEFALGKVLLECQEACNACTLQEADCPVITRLL